MTRSDPSLRSGFRLRAPAALTPAKRLNLTSGDFVGNGFGENVDASHGRLQSQVSQMPADKAKALVDSHARLD
ncbi:MAG: hypothetical protein WB711_13725 [Terriglobales bacterium]